MHPTGAGQSCFACLCGCLRGLRHRYIKQQRTGSSVEFFLETYFSSAAGPITTDSFNGPINPAFNQAGTSAQQINYTLTGFGPGGADNPIFTPSPGAYILDFTAVSATFNPTLGTVSGTQYGSAFGAPAIFNLTETGSNFSGSFTFNNGSAPSSVQFVTSPGFAVDYFSTCVADCVSTVPLPPALPMFATGLLALVVFGFVTRKRSRLASI
jgi:hypothetical protein